MIWNQRPTIIPHIPTSHKRVKPLYRDLTFVVWLFFLNSFPCLFQFCLFSRYLKIFLRHTGDYQGHTDGKLVKMRIKSCFSSPLKQCFHQYDRYHFLCFNFSSSVVQSLLIHFIYHGQINVSKIPLSCYCLLCYLEHSVAPRHLA